MRRLIFSTASVLLSLVSGSCDGAPQNSGEQYVILDTSPFFEAELSSEIGDDEAVIAAARSFADRHQMQLLLAQQALGPGEFNVSAVNASINLSATHVRSFGPVTKVRAITRGAPSQAQRDLAEEFMSDVQGAIAQ